MRCDERGWRFRWCVAALRAARRDESKVRLQESDQVVASSAIRRSQESANSNPPQGCAGNGGDYRFGMLSHSAIALPGTPHCRSRSRATRDGRADSARRISAAME